MEGEILLRSILRRLDVLVALELERPVGDDLPNVSTKVERLLPFGLTHAEMAQIVGKSAKNVGAVVSNLRKQAKQRKGD